jgi:hypothetical protein
VSTLPRWARRIQRKLLARPGIDTAPRCDGCQRITATCDMRDGLCGECDRERRHAFDDAFGSDKPFMLWDDTP